jgi:molybdopterin/thiamine biosynthesis adenylyltransferase
MILFLILVAGIWALGHFMKAPVSARWLMICLIYLMVVALQLVLPAENPLRLAFGGELGEWVMLGILGGAVWAYRVGLGKLRKRVRSENQPVTAKAMSNTTERYTRHIVLREIGGTGQKRLREAKVLVVGAGGLGSPVIQYLAAAGVGQIGIIDDDIVDVSNLQRQIIHTEKRTGMPKVFSAKEAVAAQNPLVEVRPYNRRLTEDIAAELFSEFDLIVEGSDDVSTKYLANEAAWKARKPLIFGAISQWEGQVSLFDPVKGGPCYRCLFPQATKDGLAPSCAEGGVLGPLPGVIGTIMATEAIKQLTGAGETLHARLLIYDALHGEIRTIALQQDPRCPVCSR